MNAAEWLLGGEPARIALIEGDVRIDYAGLRADAIRSAAALLDAGLRPGDACCCRDGAGERDAERVGPGALCETGERRFHRNTSEEIDAAEEDLPAALAAGIGPPQRPGVVALLGLHARV